MTERPGDQEDQLNVTEQATDSTATAGSLIVASVIWVILLVIVVMSLDFAWAARRAPLLFGAATWALVTVVLVKEIVEFRAARRSAEDRRSEEPNPAVGEGPNKWRSWMPFAWLAVLAATFVVLGFNVGMALFMILFFRIYGRESWRTTLSVTIGVMLCIYGLFIEVLGIRMYPGIISEMIQFPGIFG